ncbi:hypothetical protein DPMN_150821 [Dreissena polymorpha]|uniref:Uncharacterized protein n=1 Tax=Dreissena polymorpha TaxID=45954 RepID=A0A9D4FE02_DREPO|nr:hypothetical protein DPMN_150821 [Dreissena polymorpha]
MKIGQKNLYSRQFTCFYYIHIEKTAPPPGGHVFSPIITILELVRDIYKIDATNVTSRENDPRPGGHVFSPIQTIFELNHRIQETNILTKFHEDWTKTVSSKVFTCFHYIHIEKTAPSPGGHFHDDREKMVTSKVFTRFLYSHIKNTAPTPGGLHEDWASNVTSKVFTSFELGRGFIGTNFLTKFHEDRKKVWPLECSQLKMLKTDDGQKAITKAHH